MTTQLSGNVERFGLAVRPKKDCFTYRIVDRAFRKVLRRVPMRALRGAAQTLAMHKPVLLLALNKSALQRFRSSARKVKDLSTRAGYQGWLIGRSLIQLISEMHSSHDCDKCIFIHEKNKPLMRNPRLRLR